MFRRAGEGRLERFDILPRHAGNVTALLKDAEGRIWAGHSSGLLIFKPEPAAGGRQPWRVAERSAEERAECRVRLPGAPGAAYHYTEADRLGKR